MADGDLAGPPKEAVDYLRRKGVRAGYDYREVWREEHAHAFTIANMIEARPAQRRAGIDHPRN